MAKAEAGLDSFEFLVRVAPLSEGSAQWIRGFTVLSVSVSVFMESSSSPHVDVVLDLLQSLPLRFRYGYSAVRGGCGKSQSLKPLVARSTRHAQ